ncbi:MAG: hypothetical protein KGL61_16605, partial [Burkholderiales bacterium]|nr:hypothetical protein [Burkholderiales bacterium]
APHAMWTLALPSVLPHWIASIFQSEYPLYYENTEDCKAFPKASVGNYEMAGLSGTVPYRKMSRADGLRKPALL